MLERRARPDDERGAVIVIVALTLVVLMVFAAFVMDIGAQYLERRQDVTSADAGVLAGTLKLLQPATLGNKNLVGQQVVEVARLNLHSTPSPTAWNDAFATCTDPNRNLTEYPTGNNYRPLLTDGRITDCVHFNDGFTRVRVLLPLQNVPTGFARVIGIKNLQTTAAAEAQIVRPFESGQAIPFALRDQGGNPNDLLCIRLDRACSGPTNQATRIIDSPYFGNSQFNTSLSCGSMFSSAGNLNGDSNPQNDPTIGTRAANNIAVSLDHNVVVKLSAEAKRTDDCVSLANPVPNPLPNLIYAHEFDNIASNYMAAARLFVRGAGDGLAFGTIYSDGGPPRLQRFPNWWPSTRTLVKNGSSYTVDDRPLWDYIRPNATNIPAICARDTFDPEDVTVGNPQNTGNTIGHMVLCLNAWQTSHAPLFDFDSDGNAGNNKFDIMFSPRTALVPLVGSCSGNCGNNPAVPILSFQVAYIQTMYFSTTDNCPCVEYNPGKGLSGSDGTIGSKNVVGLSTYRIKDGMLPAPARPQPPDGSLHGFVSLIR